MPEGCVFIALGFNIAVAVKFGLFMVWEREPILSVFALLELERLFGCLFVFFVLEIEFLIVIVPVPVLMSVPFMSCLVALLIKLKLNLRFLFGHARVLSVWLRLELVEVSGLFRGGLWVIFL